MISTIRQSKIRYLLIGLFWLFAWQVLYKIIDQPLFLASPLETVKALWMRLAQVETWKILGNTSGRIVTGYFAAIILGMVFASISYNCAIFEELIKPMMMLMKSIPVASFIVIALAWFSAKNVSGFITWFVVFPLIYFHVLAALRRVDYRLLEVCQVFQVKNRKKWKYIYVPQIMEEFPAILKLTVGMGIRSAIAAELIGVPEHSVGEAIYKAKLYFDIADLFAWTILAVFLCWTLEKIMIWVFQWMGRKMYHG